MAAGGSTSYKMETDDFCNSAAADASTATSKTLIKCTQLPFLGEHPLHTTNCSTLCNNGLEQIKIGYFYELNHQNLPRRSPIHLKSIRVVMVTERTDYNVAVKFPSSSSLRTYFRRMGTSIIPPKLDEEFVMGSKPARDVLARQILPSEFSQRKKLESFWLVEPPKDESNEEPMVEIPVSGGGGGDKSVKGGSSILSAALNSAGMMRWGVRRRVTFVGKHKEMKNSDPAEPVVDGQSSLMEPGIKSEDEEVDVEAAVEGLMEEDSTDEKRMRTRKRTREISLRSRKKAKTTKEHEKIKGKRSRRKNKSKKVISAEVSIKKKISTAGASIKKKIAGEQGKDKLSYDRWSKERYKTAEGRMLDILKETKAVFGQPILRRDLRLEARKHIGDTGLLDHLLKHMAGKVAPNGEDRFRRRHNSEGEMEYWLESADLVNVRKEAGVNDPYWTPPPGWKLGDNPSQHPVCAKELMLIKEEMADLKRINMEELLVLKSSMSCITKEATVHVAGSLEGGQGNLIQQLLVAALMSSSRNNNLSPTIATVVVVAPLKEMYESLVEKKAQLEQQLVEISVSLNQMQKEVGKRKADDLILNENDRERAPKRRSGFSIRGGGTTPSPMVESSMSCITKEATVHVAGSLEGGQGNLIQQLPVAALMSSSSNNNLSSSAGVVAPLKGMYESLVEKKAQLEQQLVEISDSLNQMQVIVTNTTTTGGPTETIMFGDFPVTVAVPQPEPLQIPEIEVPVPQPEPQLNQIPRDYFTRGSRTRWWEDFHYVFVLQFGIAERYMDGLSIHSLVSEPTIHGLWLCPNPGKDEYKQNEFKKELVNEQRLLKAWPSYFAKNNDPSQAGNKRPHEKFWNVKEWDGHGRKGPMRQKAYYDFVLNTFDHFGPLVAAAVDRNTITNQILASSVLDPEAFLLDMRSRGWYPTIHARAKTSKACGITSRFQALTQVRFYMDVDDPRITLNPYLLYKENKYEKKLDINVITSKIISPENR